MDIIESIRDAIRNKHIIQFTYEGRIRISEPHVLGIKNGITEMLMFQIGGESSSGGLPNWRRVKIPKIKDFQITDKTFAGKRPTQTGQHTDFDTVIELVD